MWDTLKATHGNINESKEVRSRSQARRKRRQNRKSLNLCFMVKKEDDSSSVSSSNSSNSENYSQLLPAFQETHEEVNRLALLNNQLKGMNSWFENRVKTLEEKLENSKTDFENLEIVYKNSSCKCDTLVKIVKILKRKFIILLKLWISFQKVNPTLRMSSHLKTVFLEKLDWVLIHRTSKIDFQSHFRNCQKNNRLICRNNRLLHASIA